MCFCVQLLRFIGRRTLFNYKAMGLIGNHSKKRLRGITIKIKTVVINACSIFCHNDLFSLVLVILKLSPNGCFLVVSGNAFTSMATACFSVLSSSICCSNKLSILSPGRHIYYCTTADSATPFTNQLFAVMMIKFKKSLVMRTTFFTRFLMYFVVHIHTASVTLFAALIAGHVHIISPNNPQENITKMYQTSWLMYHHPPGAPRRQ